jgi:hypothetical protein
VEADFGFWRFWWRFEQWSELLKDFSKRGVMEEQGLVNFGQAFKDGGISGKVLAYFDEGTDDVNAHGDRPGTVQYVGRHQGAMFAEGVGSILRVLAAARL